MVSYLYQFLLKLKFNKPIYWGFRLGSKWKLLFLNIEL